MLSETARSRNFLEINFLHGKKQYFPKVGGGRRGQEQVGKALDEDHQDFENTKPVILRCFGCCEELPNEHFPQNP